MELFKTKKTPTDLNESERLAWLRLSRTDNIGPITFYKLLEHFGSASEALAALPEMSKRGGRKKPLIAPPAGQIEKEYAALQKLGGALITAADKEYPLALGATDDAPPVLSILGDITLLNKSCIAIVGARNASLNGRKFAQKIAGDLGKRGQIIVSGLARGIDTAAHEGSIEKGTIAVVAGGIDVVYPEENMKLYDAIKKKGTIIAESPLGQKPFAASFPRRNRIVSGISKGVIVIEATQRSGSLITARLAGEQGRDVYAMPGSPLDPRAAGPNHLIREGATLIRNADDVIEGLMNFSGGTLREPETDKFRHFSYQNPAAEQDITSEIPRENLQDMILENLSFTPIQLDELVRSCHVSVSDLQSVFLELELAGRVKRLPGGRVILVESE
ncbi:MAG: DNA-processing protein DprA [Alphaproteobacteria bacterium]|nr:DNA-processing protein DprA [Alphaproteobacteria bacterium]